MKNREEKREIREKFKTIDSIYIIVSILIKNQISIRPFLYMGFCCIQKSLLYKTIK